VQFAVFTLFSLPFSLPAVCRFHFLQFEITGENSSRQRDLLSMWSNSVLELLQQNYDFVLVCERYISICDVGDRRSLPVSTRYLTYLVFITGESRMYHDDHVCGCACC
jgi:hypothetical protein